MEGTLGKFITEYDIDGSTFYLRGLTVAEYSDLAKKGLLRLTNRLFIEIAVVGLVGWSDLWVEDGDVEIPVIFGEGATAQDLGEKELVEIGQHIYYEMTTISNEMAQKIKGFIRFLYWSSEDKNKTRAETFDCQVCLEKGLAASRPCGRFEMSHRLEYLEDKFKERQKAVSEERATPRRKYGNSKLKDKRESKLKRYAGSDKADSKDNEPAPVGRNHRLILGKFDYPECPVSWVDEWLKIMAEVMYHSEKSNIPMFEGGLMDQPYQVYRAAKIVKSEYSAIESEKMEAERKKNKKK